jgi:hypothetical protein
MNNQRTKAPNASDPDLKKHFRTLGALLPLIALMSAAEPIVAQSAYEFPDYIKPSNTDAGDRFAYAIAADGNTLVVSARDEGSAATGVDGDQSDNSAPSSGAVYVFVRDIGGGWEQQAYLKASNTDSYSDFGTSVALSGDTLVVGAPREDSGATGVNGDQDYPLAVGSGAAYVFVRSGTSWSQQAYLKASNTDIGDAFGSAVAIHGDTIVVGAPDEDSFASGVNGNQFDNTVSNAGAAYVFSRSGTTWTQQAYLKASNTEADDHFGEAVAVHGNRIAVGAKDEDSNATGINGNQSNDLAENAGAVYVFQRLGTVWSEDAYLKASNTDPGDEFGGAVSLFGDTLAVGARLESSQASGIDGDQASNSTAYSGAVYLFEHDGSDWAQHVYVKASNAGGLEFFGRAIDLKADRMIIGAYAEDSATVGVDGNQDDFGANSSGAAYVFERTPDSWQQISYLKASNTDEGDSLGFSVAIGEGFAAAGAFVEQGAATDINGDDSDNSADNAGAVYAYSAPRTYSIEGAVSGLVGSGLAIQLNSAETLPLTADGAFAFSTRLREGAGYAVSIQSQPSQPTQFCRLANETGLIAGANVSDIEVNCDPPILASGFAFNEYIKASNTDDADEFGLALAVDGDTLVVGAAQEDSSTIGIGGAQGDNSALQAGAVYAYLRDPSGVWSFDRYIKASNTDAGDNFGLAVALSGDTLVVGAPGEDSAATGFNGDQLDDSQPDAGAVYVFVRDGSGQWFPEAYLKASNTDAGDLFGSSVAVSGDTIVVGAPGEDSGSSGVDSDQDNNSADDAGAAYVFVRSGASWSQQAYLKPSNSESNDLFGGAVDIDGDAVIVGSRHEDGGDSSGVDESAAQAGAAYVFFRTDSAWSQDAYLKADEPDAGDFFGRSVAIDGRFAAVGADLDDGPDNQNEDIGRVYVFERVAGGWSQDQALFASNAEAADRFGYAVDISDRQILVGAWQEDSASTGVDDHPLDNDLTDAGAAYLFSRDFEQWQESHVLKSHAPDESDYFGAALAISGGLIAIGASAEDSRSVGVGGDATDNSGFFNGAVYAYDAASYAVGGSVSGLAGSGLTLRLNGEELLAISTNGPFEFDQRSLAGSVYSVDILSLPGNPQQSCRVTNGSGYVPNQDVTSIEVECISAYRIGGTVTGVAGPGLILQNNGGDDLTITSNGTFIFPTRVGDGQAYEVTVASTPSSPNQRCQVSNGSGIVQGQNVQDVQVQCQTVYTIGGTVSGLDGEGLVLAINGGDRLPISGNGNFQFSRALPSGTSFEVTIRRNPDFPPQLCQVDNGSGTVQNQAVSNIEVTCVSGYRIGGTVTGVDGPGLVLANNGGPPFFISENGPFEFPRFALDGSAYSVTIEETSVNPPQSCQISNSSGTVQGQDVDDIEVSCETGYRVGGQATGVQGPGLVLANNGSDELSIIANGGFIFDQRLNVGEAYNVTVIANPESPEQLCSIANGTGEAIDTDIDNVQIECKRARRIGGTVQGLQGQGLIVKLNHSSLLEIDGNGPFQFPLALPDGSAYQVVIDTQPTEPSQTCTVINGSGQASGGDVVDVLLDCEPPQQYAGQIQFPESSISVSESDGMVQLVIQRVGGSDGAITVRVASIDGSAIGGQDFVELDTQKFWPDGEDADRSVDIVLIDDEAEEPTEQFHVALEIISGEAAVGTIGQIELTIINDDGSLFADRFEAK